MSIDLQRAAWSTALMALLQFAQPSAAQDADFIALTKSQNFQQLGPHLVTFRDDQFVDADQAPFIFEAFVESPDPGLLQGATLTLPDNSMQALTFDGPVELQLLRGFTRFGLMELEFPPGPYSLQIDTANDGSPSVGLSLPADGYPALTKFTVFDQAQSVVAAQPSPSAGRPFPMDCRMTWFSSRSRMWTATSFTKALILVIPAS